MRSTRTTSPTAPVLEGFVHPDFQEVATTLERQVPGRDRGGAAVCVYHHGECVVDLWAGTRDGAGRPWKRDTLSLSYSTTKGVISTLLHVLVDRGLADYDDPVCRYWPEFADGDKQDITLRHVLSHEAGLYDIRSMIDDARRMLDWSHMVGCLERARPLHEPGEAHGYHGLTYGWLVGELIARIGGAPLRTLLEREISEPLCLDGLYIGLQGEALARRAKLIEGRLPWRDEIRAPEAIRARRIRSFFRYRRGPFDASGLEAALMPHGIEALDFNDEDFVGSVIPAVNGMFNARSLARMYAALCGDGPQDGKRLLSQRGLERMTEVQNRHVGRVLPLPMEWRLGYHAIPMARVAAPRCFGHFGIGGSGAWADPDRDLAVALVQNSGWGTPFGDTRVIRIGSVAAYAADRRDREGRRSTSTSRP
jgi:CubicO group peptidase (beta-lactamase class C family)